MPAIYQPPSTIYRTREAAERDAAACNAQSRAGESTYSVVQSGDVWIVVIYDEDGVRLGNL